MTKGSNPAHAIKATCYWDSLPLAGISMHTPFGDKKYESQHTHSSNVEKLPSYKIIILKLSNERN